MKCETCKKAISDTSEEAVSRKIGGKLLTFCGVGCLGKYIAHVREWLQRNRPTQIGGHHVRSR